MPKLKFNGTIISDKMDKTVVVKVEKVKRHPKYGKKYKVSKKYKAHCESGKYKIGDRVVIEECRPMSKNKKWRVICSFEEFKQKSGNQKSKAEKH